MKRAKSNHEATPADDTASLVRSVRKVAELAWAGSVIAEGGLPGEPMIVAITRLTSAARDVASDPMAREIVRKFGAGIADDRSAEARMFAAETKRSAPGRFRGKEPTK